MVIWKIPISPILLSHVIPNSEADWKSPPSVNTFPIPILSVYFPFSLLFSLSHSFSFAMADGGSYGLSPRLDIDQLLLEAQHRWLRPAEICEILRNHQKFQISSEPPNRPPSGSLFLFDRKVLRYFRKDGYNWRKKRDGKTVKEAHEKLKVGSIDVLHCYYAHGEEYENFQRRSYWMLEEDLMHIVFVHYLEVKGNRTNVGASRETAVSSSSEKGSPKSFTFPANRARAASGIVDSPSTTSTLTSLCEDADSEDSYQATSDFRSFLEFQQMGNGPLMDKIGVGSSSYYHPSQSFEYVPQAHKDGPMDNNNRTCEIDSQKTIGSSSWEEILQQCTTGFDAVPSPVSPSSVQPSTEILLGQENMISGPVSLGDNAVNREFGISMSMPLNGQILVVDNSLPFPKGFMDQLSDFEPGYDQTGGVSEHRNQEPTFGSAHGHGILCTLPDMQNEQASLNNLQFQLRNRESQGLMKMISENDMPLEGNITYASALKQSLLGEESLKKVDSFSRWITKELGEVDDLHMKPSSGIPWSAVECGNIIDDSSLSPSLSQEQLFTIIEFSPKWTFTDLETEVLIIGRFLETQQCSSRCNWSCMFGEVEVPAEVLADGILCCRAPPHSVGLVPFYVTYSNRVACSEVREFHYLAGSAKDLDVTHIYNGVRNELVLHMQLDQLLSSSPLRPPNILFEYDLDKRNIVSKLLVLKEEDDSYMKEPNPQGDLTQRELKEYLFKKLMKEKLYLWLLRQVIENDKGPNVLDDKGQGVIHLTAALGYDWALKPIVIAGVSINFRDVNGWTGLHWAAFCGREQTVVVLLSLGAAPGAVTDPSPDYTWGRTPADLASANGHKGISGFLAESLLTSYLSSLTMNDSKKDGATKDSATEAVHPVSERMATPVYGCMPHELSLKDSLSAVRNATQAADRIYMMFRMQSFQRKKFAENDDELGIADERALSLATARTRKPGQGDGLAHAAAVRIQKKFRGWKKRKEFLIIRQRIVKIQAHVRGHQVRKQYRRIVWSVGIMEKIILRWRRKGSGLRGFRPEAITKEPPSTQSMPAKDDDYDFLKEGRRQTEERLQKALTRVKSMAQYPEGRDQYRRLLTVVQGFRESKLSQVSKMVITTPEETPVDEDLIDFDALLDDETLMSITFD